MSGSERFRRIDRWRWFMFTRRKKTHRNANTIVVLVHTHTSGLSNSFGVATCPSRRCTSRRYPSMISPWTRNPGRLQGTRIAWFTHTVRATGRSNIVCPRRQGIHSGVLCSPRSTLCSNQEIEKGPISNVIIRGCDA